MRIVLCYPVGSRHVEQIRAAAPEAEVIDAGQQRIAQEILDADIKSIFSRLGLDRHLSPARRNGLNGMVERIRSIAQSAA